MLRKSSEPVHPQFPGPGGEALALKGTARIVGKQQLSPEQLRALRGFEAVGPGTEMADDQQPPALIAALIDIEMPVPGAKLPIVPIQDQGLRLPVGQKLPVFYLGS